MQGDEHCEEIGRFGSVFAAMWPVAIGCALAAVLTGHSWLWWVALGAAAHLPMIEFTPQFLVWWLGWLVRPDKLRALRELPGERFTHYLIGPV